MIYVGVLYFRVGLDPIIVFLPLMSKKTYFVSLNVKPMARLHGVILYSIATFYWFLYIGTSLYCLATVNSCTDYVFTTKLERRSTLCDSNFWDVNAVHSTFTKTRSTAHICDCFEPIPLKTIEFLFSRHKLSGNCSGNERDAFGKTSSYFCSYFRFSHSKWNVPSWKAKA